MTTDLSFDQLQNFGWIMVSLYISIFFILMYAQGAITLIGQAGMVKEGNHAPSLGATIGWRWVPLFGIILVIPMVILGLFPRFFDLIFSGAMWICLAIVVSFLAQAVSFEYYRKSGIKSRMMMLLLIVSGFSGALLSGVLLATFFTGHPFTPATPETFTVGATKWVSPTYGFILLTDWRNVVFGLSMVFLTRILGGLFLLDRTNEASTIQFLRRGLILDGVLFLMFFIAFTFSLLMMPGQYIENITDRILWEPLRYRKNFLQVPVIMFLYSAGAVFILLGILLSVATKKRASEGLWYTLAGGMSTIFSLLILAGFNRTVFYHSKEELSNSLTIYNSSSDADTLTASLLLSLIPIVLFLAWYLKKRSLQKRLLSN